jgi:hypothetical protein
MGLSVHYSGKIKSYPLINLLVEEVKDICGSMKWNYGVMDAGQSTLKPGDVAKKYTPKDVKGICFTPDECETIALTFLPDNTLCCPAKLTCYDPESNDLMIEWISVKTQFAGIQTHIAVLKLLQYLKEKYFESFELDDEGEYWGVWNEEILQRRFDTYNFLLNSVAEALSNIPAIPGESAASMAARIEAIIKERLARDKK